MSDTTGQTAPPGWHPDPKDPTRLRFWDGTQWTEHTSDAADEAASTEQPQVDQTPHHRDDSAPQASTDDKFVFASVKGWKPVRRKRVDDRAALRKGTLIGFAVAVASWVLLGAVGPRGQTRYVDFVVFSRNFPNGYRFIPSVSLAPLDLLPLVGAGLALAAVVAGWQVARAATNSRAGLSAAAAAGAVFAASVAVPAASFAFDYLRGLLKGLYMSVFLRICLSVVEHAAVYAVLALLFGVVGWLIGRPRPLTVDATASLDLTQLEASDELTLLLSGLRNQRVDRASLSTVSVSLRFYPAWAVLLGVLLFPLGVLAVLVGQREETGTIIVNDVGDGSSTFQARGLFDEAACTRIEAFLVDNASDA